MTDYITMEDLADYMEVDEMPWTSAELHIAAAQQAVRKYLDQDVTRAAVLEVRDGKARSRIRLWQRPVRSIESVTVDDVVIEDSVYFVRENVLYLRRGNFGQGRGNVVIAYESGWDVVDELDSEDDDFQPVPADIRLVTLSVAARNFRDQGEDSAKTGENIGQYGYTSESTADLASILLAERSVLDLYAVRRVP